MQNVAPIKQEERIKVTPEFMRLSPEDVETFKNIGEDDAAKKFMNDLASEVSHETLAGMMLLLDEICRKIDRKDYLDNPVDFIKRLQRHLFMWTDEMDDCVEAYIAAARTGNVTVFSEETEDSETELIAA